MKVKLLKSSLLALLFTAEMSEAKTYRESWNEDSAQWDIFFSEENSNWFRNTFPYKQFLYKDDIYLLEILPSLDPATLFKYATGKNISTLSSPFDQKRAEEQGTALFEQAVERVKQELTIDTFEINNLCVPFKERYSVYEYTCQPNNFDKTKYGFDVDLYDFKTQQYETRFRSAHIPLLNTHIRGANLEKGSYKIPASNRDDILGSIYIPMPQSVAEVIYNQSDKVIRRMSYKLSNGTPIYGDRRIESTIVGIEFKTISAITIEFYNIDTKEVLYRADNLKIQFFDY